MVKITSRKELEEWLKDKPVDWGRIIAARAALRVLPIAFIPISKNHSADDQSHSVTAQISIRAAYLLWAISLNPRDNTNQKANLVANSIYYYASGYISVDWERDSFGISDDVAAEAARHAIYSALISDSPESCEASADAAYAGCGMANDQDGRSIIWKSVNDDATWLLNQKKFRFSVFRLIVEPLWLFDPAEWPFYGTIKRLLILDPTYQVWIDWYNRRIEGRKAAFDILGDVDRVHDKAILIRLADATDEDFWGKGATHVNTTLQNWIDEARINAEINEILVKLRAGAATRIGMPDEFEARRALLDAFDRLSGKPPMEHGGIGHNYPPEGLDLVETTAALPSEVREPIEAMATELQKSEPDPIIVAEKALLFHRIIRKFEKMASVAGDKFAEGFGDELGKGAGKLVTRLPYALIALPLIEPILAWLRSVIG